MCGIKQECVVKQEFQLTHIPPQAAWETFPIGAWRSQLSGLEFFPNYGDRATAGTSAISDMGKAAIVELMLENGHFFGHCPENKLVWGNALIQGTFFYFFLELKRQVNGVGCHLFR
ncbi:hypothetical protein AM228_17120 [Planktothricoides sp. SR001]|nr:hypothetical protein AM228_17120 [Planktothricoides sp. SR001]